MPKPKTKIVTEREVKYPAVKIEICRDKKAIGEKRAKELLGWQELPDDDKREADGISVFLDLNKKRVECLYNHRNRPFTREWSITLAQDILNKNYRFNGENIIIGETGLVLSGQHRLIGVVFAHQMWEPEEAYHWREKWPTAPSIESLICYGINESPDTIRTLDNTRKRTLSDVLFSDDNLFADFTPKQRKGLVRSLEYCVRTLWYRTGARRDAFSPKLTHSEALEFIERHPKVKQVVQYITKKDKDGGVSVYLPIGTAAALMYLMACSNSDGDKYRNSDPPNEKVITFGLMKKAEQFWSEFAVMGATPMGEFRAVREAIAGMVDPESGQGGATLSERIALTILAWGAYSQDRSVNSGVLSLTPYQETNEDGITYLIDAPRLRGIDQGDPAFKEVDDSDDDDETPSPRRRRKGKDKAAAESNGHAEDEAGPDDDDDADTDDYDTGDDDDDIDSNDDDSGDDDEIIEDDLLADTGPVDPSEEEIEARAAEQRQAREAKAKGPKPKAKGASSTASATATAEPEAESIDRMIDQLKEKYGDKLMLFRNESICWAWGQDAHTLSKILKVPMKASTGTMRAEFKASELDKNLGKLTSAGVKVALCEQHGPTTKVIPITVAV